MPKEWIKVNIPRKMRDYIQKLIDDPTVEKIFGFTSIADFVTKATADKIREIENEIQKLNFKPSESSRNSDFES